MNKHAGNFGDVVKHLLLAELLERERSRIKTYIDPYAGSPVNDLSNAAYLYSRRSKRTRAAGLPWADRYVQLASVGALRRAQYTRILKNLDFPGRTLYPGSAQIAADVLGTHARLLLADNDASDARALRRLPRARVARSLSPDHPWVAASLEQSAFVLVDPFNLRTDSTAQSFVIAAARVGALVMAWYPLYGPTGHPDIDKLWNSLVVPKSNRSVRVEVGWGRKDGASMCGAGMIISSVTSLATLRKLDGLRGGLQPLFDACGKVLNGTLAAYK